MSAEIVSPIEAKSAYARLTIGFLLLGGLIGQIAALSETTTARDIVVGGFALVGGGAILWQKDISNAQLRGIGSAIAAFSIGCLIGMYLGVFTRTWLPPVTKSTYSWESKSLADGSVDWSRLSICQRISAERHAASAASGEFGKYVAARRYSRWAAEAASAGACGCAAAAS